MSDVRDSAALKLLFPIALESEGRGVLMTNEEEVTVLFGEYRYRVIRYLACLGVSLQDGEEIVQEVFILLFHHLREQKSRQNLRGWIFRVAHNLGLKKRIESQRWNWERVHADLPLLDPAPSPEEQMVWKQQQKRMVAALEALPAQDRSCLYLRAEGLRYREISHVLDISIGSVAQSLARAVKRLSYACQR